MANSRHEHEPLEAPESPKITELRQLLASSGQVALVSSRDAPHALTVSLGKSSVVVLPIGRPSVLEWQTLEDAIDPGKIPVLLAGVDSDEDSIRRGLEWGAADYFLHPWVLADILPRIRRAEGPRTVRNPAPPARKEKLLLEQMVGQSRVFRAVVNRLPAIAACDASVLITGETGSGKELCARAIHYLGNRAKQPFVPLNCGAISPELAENELFGHAPGAFTSANSRQNGLIQEAENGSLFLDEVDSLPPAVQVKLLRFLQSREFRPLGSPRTLTANVRMIAATNADITAAVKSRQFRQDLYYRLNVVPLQLPPLRNRLEDIPLLARHFLHRYTLEYGKTITGFTEEAMEQMISYEWPGNARELENLVARAVVLAESSCLGVEDLDFLAGGKPLSPSSLRSAKSAFERAYIEQKLQSSGGNISRAARAAGKNRRSFWELIRKHGIEVDKFRASGDPATPARTFSASQ
jgi:DNA-binding NtrC family response regulator